MIAANAFLFQMNASGVHMESRGILGKEDLMSLFYSMPDTHLILLKVKILVFKKKCGIPAWQPQSCSQNEKFRTARGFQKLLGLRQET